MCLIIGCSPTHDHAKQLQEYITLSICFMELLLLSCLLRCCCRFCCSLLPLPRDSEDFDALTQQAGDGLSGSPEAASGEGGREIQRAGSMDQEPLRRLHQQLQHAKVPRAMTAQSALDRELQNQLTVAAVSPAAYISPGVSYTCICRLM